MPQRLLSFLEGKSLGPLIDQKNINERKDAKILALRNKNLDLKIKIKNLRTQLEVIYGELYKLKQDNKN